MGADGVTPIAVGLIGDLFPYRERGKALGLFFATVAGGMAFGLTAGVLLEPFVGWQGLFAGVAVLSACITGSLLPHRTTLPASGMRTRSSFIHHAQSFIDLLSSRRGR